MKIVIVGAGAAAHLAGMIAGQTVRPVIGVPIDSSPLSGFDALLSTVQMPPGVPVAAVGLDRGENAAILATEILAVKDERLADKLKEEDVEGKPRAALAVTPQLPDARILEVKLAGTCCAK